MSKSLEKRVTDIELQLNCVPGTILQRGMNDGELQWCLAIGPMQMPKKMFWGDTWLDVIKQAEEWAHAADDSPR